jgi:cytochrome P450
VSDGGARALPSASEEFAGRRFFRTPATSPGPLGPEMLRHVGLIRGNPLGFLEQSWRRYGDVVQFPIPRPPSYLVNDPDGVRRILVTNARNYGKGTIQYRSLSLVTGEGLLVADNEPWRRQRRMVQPAFHHQTLEGLVRHVAAALDRVSESWDRAIGSRTDALVDVDGAMMHAALEIVGHALFGTDLSQDAARLASATLDALDVVVARARVPVTPPSWLPTPANRRLRRAVSTLDAAVGTMIAQRTRMAANHREPSDMLDLLLGSTDETGDRLSPAEVRDQVVTFIVAGHETAASALTWAWALLAEHPGIQDDLAREATAVLADRTVTWDDYSRLPLARAVLDETLRLYPPAWLITRSVAASDEVGGRTLPARSLVILSPWLLHRHPAAWPEPGRFRPERFLDGSADRTAFIPFGAGPRMCIGRDFAYVESVLMLSALARRFRVSFADGRGVPEGEPLVTIRPKGGLYLRVSRR